MYPSGGMSTPPPVMIGSMITHARRKEPQAIAFNVVLLILAAVVAWGRFGPYSL